MGYTQLTQEERYLIASQRKLGCSLRLIARELGRCPCTISRELRRNSGTGAVNASHEIVPNFLADARFVTTQYDGDLQLAALRHIQNFFLASLYQG